MQARTWEREGPRFFRAIAYKYICLDIRPLPCNQIWHSLHKNSFEIVRPTKLEMGLQNVWFNCKNLAQECWLLKCAPSSAPFLLFVVLFISQCPTNALSGIKIFYFEKFAKSSCGVLSLYHKFTDRVAALCATISKDFQSVWIEQANEKLSKCKEIVHVQTVWNAHTA